MKEITIQIPDDCEVQIVKKKNIFKKGDVIVSKISGLIAIYEHTKIENNKKVVYYSTLYSTTPEIFMSINQINKGIGYENNCCLATQEQKAILINALKLKAKSNNEAKTVLKEVFNIYEPIIRTYQDLIDYKTEISGYYIDECSYIGKITVVNEFDKNIAATEKVAKSMLAMAMISQLMPYYGGAISDEEWTNSKTKYVIVKISNEIQKDDFFRKYHFLAFHTKEQRDDFLKYNEQLVKDYLMIE